jgi:hypothetical protein
VPAHDDEPGAGRPSGRVEAVRIVPLIVGLDRLRVETWGSRDDEAEGLGGRRHLRHRWQERSRGKDDRWQECRSCGTTGSGEGRDVRRLPLRAAWARRPRAVTR